MQGQSVSKGEKRVMAAGGICKTPHRGWVYKKRSGGGRVQGGNRGGGAVEPQ